MLKKIMKKIEIFNIINFENFWLYGFSYICIIILINDVIMVWIGNKFILPLNISIILAINFYMIGMQNAVWTFKNTMGSFIYGRYILLVTAVLNLILSIILGKYFGLFRILLATAIARLLTNVWYDPYAVYRYGLKIRVFKYFKRYLKYSFILIVTLLISFYISNFIKVDSFIKLIIKGVICVIISNLSFFLFFYKSKEFLYYKNLLFILMDKILKNMF